MAEQTWLKNYDSINERMIKACLRAGRDPSELTLVAASKGQSVEKIISLVQERGHKDFGENYIQEMVSKKSALFKAGIDNVRWHFLGRLQSNKLRLIVENSDFIHAVDSEDKLNKIHSLLKSNPRASSLKLFLAWNFADEKQKSGVFGDVQLAQLAGAAMNLTSGNEVLKMLGIMGLPPPRSTRSEWLNPSQMIEDYRLWVSSAKNLTSLHQISLGMSDDFEEAIEAGATFLRIGSAIFGAR